MRIFTTAEIASILNSLTTSTGYIGLITGVTDHAAGTVTEVSGGSYARASINGVFPTATGASVTSTAQVNFAEATAPWGTITHFGIWAADSGGSPRAIAQLDVATNITTGQTARFNAGDLTLEGLLPA